jgi:hypothetical protein
MIQFANMAKARRTWHGMIDTRTYRCWQRMRNRCNNPNATQYKWYGGRGIRVCERWDLFENFLADMGKAPSDEHTIGRKEHDKNYEPGNCEWQTMSEQRRQTYGEARDLSVTYRGETLGVGEWARRLGINRHTIYNRLRYGWTSEEIFSTKGRGRTRRSDAATFLQYNGKRLTVCEWAHKLNINRTTIYSRLRQGWSAAQALGKEPRSYRDGRSKTFCPHCGKPIYPKSKNP